MSLLEYDNNTYIRGLPPIEGQAEMFKRLSRPPSWEPANLELPAVLRRHCVQRLKRYYRPGRRHLTFAEEFGMLVRNGYIGRDPAERSHEERSLQIADQARDGLLLSAARPLSFENNAESALFVGMPGMGKTSVVKEVLRSYKQVIEHPDMPPQITHLRLDTPLKGSLRGLCVDFFSKVDGLLGQESYTRLFAGQHTTEEAMLSNMALVAAFHGLGCLVIDEIQHLPHGGEKDHALLTFLVTLTNKMGVPVLFIGTMNASALFERTARMARRSVGVFGEPWDRFEPGAGQWKDFLDDLWQYQWIKTHSSLTPELRAVIYDETQGVVDLAVKLFTRVQIRSIRRSEMMPAYPEEIDAPFIREVASRDFGPVRGFVDALRSGDRDRINAFDDLSSFKREFDKATDELVGNEQKTLSIRVRREELVEVGEAASLAEQAVRAELGKKHEADVVDRIILEAKAALDEEEPDLVNLMAQVKKITKAKRSKQLQSLLRPECLIEGDIRKLARDAVASGMLIWEALADAEIGGPVALELAA